MRILLIGYGKMGKTIEKIALNRGHEIVGKIDLTNNAELTNFNYSNCDVAIEFTQPETALANIKYCVNHRLPVVCGTTGWLEHKVDVEELCREKKSAFFYASNYSIGVNLFFSINETIARMMNNHHEYKVSMQEIHHIQKLDAPSGTAITLAEGVFHGFPKIKKWTLEEEKASESTIHIDAVREGEYPGTHSVFYKSEVDTIEIKHTAHSRQGFALGAVIAAEFLQGRKGVYNMRDLMSHFQTI